jgi:hypothetical protein
MSCLVYSNITNERLRIDGADKVNVEARQGISKCWHEATRRSRWRAWCKVLGTWFSMNKSDSTGVGEKQEHCKHEEVDHGEDHHDKG